MRQRQKQKQKQKQRQRNVHINSVAEFRILKRRMLKYGGENVYAPYVKSN